jgi:hypothetical protein
VRLALIRCQPPAKCDASSFARPGATTVLLKPRVPR